MYVPIVQFKLSIARLSIKFRPGKARVLLIPGYSETTKFSNVYSTIIQYCLDCTYLNRHDKPSVGITTKLPQYLCCVF